MAEGIMDDEKIAYFQLGFLENFNLDEVIIRTSRTVKEYKQLNILLIHPSNFDPNVVRSS